jgi:predicted methyltransferase
MTPHFRATEIAHDWLRGRISPGDLAIDATAGNGCDTLFLARQVGAAGRVYAFDIQPAALAATRHLLAAEDLLDRAVLLPAGHEQMARELPGLTGTVRAIMFNLGYLPGGDKSVITLPGTTLAGLAAALCMLAPGGLITLVCYPGHPGGAAEADSVLDYCRQLDPGIYRAIRCHSLNCSRTAPFAIAIEKLSLSPPVPGQAAFTR